MSLIITRNFKRAKAQDVAARDKAPDGWWEGKTIFAAFGWGKSVKGKVVSHKGGVIKLEDGTQFKESDAYDLYAINSRAADACGKGEDAKNDFANRIMPLVRKIADAQKVVEGVLSEAEELGYDAAHGEFPDSTFAKRSANQLEAACYEAVTALRKVKTIAIL